MESVQWLCGNSDFFLAWLFLLFSWEAYLAVLLPCWKCCLLFVALITSQTFFFFLGDTQSSQNPTLFIVHGVLMDQSCHPQVLFQTYLLEMEKSLWLAHWQLPSQPRVWWVPGGVSQQLGMRMFLLFGRQWWISHKVLLALFPWVACQECDAVGAVLRTLSVERCFCGVAHSGEHQLVLGGCKACVAISSHLPLFWKLYYEPETENCPQINWIKLLN